MKKNNFLVLGMLAIVLALGLVFAACETTGSGGQDSLATADLIDALGGNAKANGSTVTLAGDARIENTLVVPSGVTLDLTADGARLFLRGGATLTVNGTVNARGYGDQDNGWVDGSLFIEDGASVINGSGKINLKGKGQLLNIWNGRKLTLDGVTLVGVKDNNNTLVEVGGNGGELILKSGKISGNKLIAEGGTPGGGVSVFDAAVFTMTGGEISGNDAEEAGGVAIGRATFIMQGGTIFGNTGFHMGGVSIGHNSTFVMEGGVIYGNTASELGSVGIVQGSFTFRGGRIQGNTDSDGFTKNSGGRSAALAVLDQNGATAKWGTGGTYTKDGVPQTGGSDVGSANETLIAVPAR